VKGKHVILSLVCLVLGFMIAFSYHFTQKKINQKNTNLTSKQWEKNLRPEKSTN
jgi:Na+-translocating ferredoxin:NAD+ oxidoreductase RnfG subunit